MVMTTKDYSMSFNPRPITAWSRLRFIIKGYIKIIFSKRILQTFGEWHSENYPKKRIRRLDPTWFADYSPTDDYTILDEGEEPEEGDFSELYDSVRHQFEELEYDLYSYEHHWLIGRIINLQWIRGELRIVSDMWTPFWRELL